MLRFHDFHESGNGFKVRLLLSPISGSRTSASNTTS